MGRWVDNSTTLKIGAHVDGAEKFMPDKDSVWAHRSTVSGPPYILTERNLRALPITETDDRLMAAAAKMGEIRMPRNG